MLLLGHNAHLIQIQGPSVPADPAKGIAGSAGVIRWTGDAQAYLDQDTTEVIKGGTHAQSQTIIAGTQAFIIDLPVNLPVWPDLDDLVTLKRMTSVMPASTYSPVQSVYKVRYIDAGLTLLAKLRIHVVYS